MPFLLTNGVFLCQLRDCLDHSASPLDGSTLSETIHNRQALLFGNLSLNATSSFVSSDSGISSHL